MANWSLRLKLLLDTVTRSWAMDNGQFRSRGGNMRFLARNGPRLWFECGVQLAECESDAGWTDCRVFRRRGMRPGAL
jgi:hypothetical protein